MKCVEVVQEVTFEQGIRWGFRQRLANSDSDRFAGEGRWSNWLTCKTLQRTDLIGVRSCSRAI